MRSLTEASLHEASIQTLGVFNFKLGREEPHEYESINWGKRWFGVLLGYY